MGVSKLLMDRTCCVSPGVGLVHVALSFSSISSNSWGVTALGDAEEEDEEDSPPPPPFPFGLLSLLMLLL